MTVPEDANRGEIQSAMLAGETVQKYLRSVAEAAEGKTPKKVIVVQKRLVSIVV